MTQPPRDYVPDYSGLEEDEPKLFGCIFAAFAICVVFAGLVVAGVFWTVRAYAHDALPTAAQPLGWNYGWDCCSAQDCGRVDDGGISETSAGYVVKRTGELISYSDKRLRRSKDEFFHRCAKNGNMDEPKSICLYVPDRGF